MTVEYFVLEEVALSAAQSTTLAAAMSDAVPALGKRQIDLED